MNWTFYEHLTDSAWLDMVSCGLCVVHGAFQNNNKLVKMKVNVTLRRFYKLLSSSPAKWADYQIITGSKLFPLKFCSKRWIENVRVAGIWRRSGVFIVNFHHISNLFPVFLLLTLSR